MDQGARRVRDSKLNMTCGHLSFRMSRGQGRESEEWEKPQ
jgi:hypothetical protein